MASQPSPAASQTRGGMPTWVKVLLVLAVVVVLGIVALVGAGYYFVRKISDEPGGPMAAVVRLANPDYEVLGVDEKDKTITVRHKKTGKQGTIAMSQLRKGAIDPKAVGMTNEEAGLKEPPAWATYPGSTVETTAGNPRATQMTLRTSDSPEKVFEYYEAQLRANGFDVTSVSLTRTLVGKSKEGRLTVTVQVLPVKDELTRVMVLLKEI